MKWFEFLRTGKFTTAKGEEVKISEQDLIDIEKNYNPDEFSAPMTLGHPKGQKEPAYGWIAAVKKFGNKLCFSPGQVVKEFAKAVNQGLFNRVSAGIENADNGTKALNHVAFLGAWKPAVSGLAKIEGLDFANQKDAVCIEFADWNKEKQEFAIAEYDLDYKFETIGDLLSSLRDFLIDKYDMETADSVLVSWQIDQVKKKLIRGEENSTQELAAEEKHEQDSIDTMEKLKSDLKELAALKDEAIHKAAAMESKAKEAVAKRTRFEFGSWADTMVEKNKLYPQNKENAVNRLLFLAGKEIQELAESFENKEVLKFKADVENNSSTELTTETARNGKGETPVATAIELAAYANKHIAEMARDGKPVGAAEAVQFVQNNIGTFREEG